MQRARQRQAASAFSHLNNDASIIQSTPSSAATHLNVLARSDPTELAAIKLACRCEYNLLSIHRHAHLHLVSFLFLYTVILHPLASM